MKKKKKEEPIKLPTFAEPQRKQGNSRKISTCFIDNVSAFDSVNYNKLWKNLKEIEIPDHLTCLLRNQHSGQEAKVRTLYGTTDWFKIERGVWQNCILSPCLFNLYAENIVQYARLDELQAGIKISGEISTSDMQMIPL